MKSLLAIKERLKALPELPYKKFPFFLIETDGAGESTQHQAKIMNAYTQFGLDAKTDIARLLAALEKCREQRDGHSLADDITMAHENAELERILNGGVGETFE